MFSKDAKLIKTKTTYYYSADVERDTFYTVPDMTKDFEGNICYLIKDYDLQKPRVQIYNIVKSQINEIVLDLSLNIRNSLQYGFKLSVDMQGNFYLASEEKIQKFYKKGQFLKEW